MSMILFDQDNERSLAVMKIEKANFSIKDINKLLLEKNIKSKQRALEILAKALLLKHMNENDTISYNSHGAPIISNDKFISISHSKELIAIIISNKRCGIDIEKISRKTLDVYERFDTLFLAKNISKELATLIWSTKEVIYKWFQKGKIDFKKDISIIKISEGSEKKINAKFREKSFVLDYLKINNHFLVYFCG